MNLLLFLSLWLSFASADQVTVHISGIPDCKPTVKATWLGEDLNIDVHKSGQLWVGAAKGDAIRYLPIHISPTQPCQGAAPEFLHNYKTQRDKDNLYVAFDRDEPRAQILSNAGKRDRIQRNEGLRMAFYGLWTAIALIGIRFLLKRSPHPKSRPLSLSLEITIWILFSLLWNGGVLFENNLPGLHQDAVGAHWLLSMASEWSGFSDPNTGWPIGAEYGRLDSFVWFAIAHASKAIEPIYIFKLFMILGPALSALAASRCISKWGATGYTPLIAGLTYGFSGLAANAALEGQAHMLMQPWLPLCLWFFTNSCQSDKPVWPGMVAGLFFGLCLLTSAYMGLTCLFAIATYWVASGSWKKISTLSIALTAVPIGIAYGLFYFSTHLEKTAIETAQSIGSLTLARLWGSTPELDRAMHGLCLGILVLPIALIIAGGIPKKMKVWLWPCGISFILAMGPYFAIDTHTTLFPLPMAWLQDLPAFNALNFPIRLAWTALLIIGWLAAIAATQLVKSGRFNRIIILLIAIECLLTNGLSNRQGRQHLPTPANWAHLNGPVYTLLPISPESTHLVDLDLEYSMLACTLQTAHKQAIAENCVGTDLESSPRITLGRWVLPLLMVNSHGDVKTGLENRGFAHIAWAPDLFHSGDRYRISKALGQLDANPIAVIDAGVRFKVYQINPTAPYNNDIPAPVYGTQWGQADHNAPFKLRIATGNSPVTPTLKVVEQDISNPLNLFSRIPDNGFGAVFASSNKPPITIDAQWNDQKWIGDITPAPGDDWIYIDPKTGVSSWPSWATSPAATEERSPATLCALIFGMIGILFSFKRKKK